MSYLKCGAAPGVPHASVNVTGYTYPYFAAYTCDEGYQVRRATGVRCLRNGTWSTPEPYCEANAAALPWWALLLAVGGGGTLIAVVWYFICKHTCAKTTCPGAKYRAPQYIAQRTDLVKPADGHHVSSVLAEDDKMYGYDIRDRATLPYDFFEVQSYSMPQYNSQEAVEEATPNPIPLGIVAIKRSPTHVQKEGPVRIVDEVKPSPESTLDSAPDTRDTTGDNDGNGTSAKPTHAAAIASTTVHLTSEKESEPQTTATAAVLASEPDADMSHDVPTKPDFTNDRSLTGLSVDHSERARLQPYSERPLTPGDSLVTPRVQASVHAEAEAPAVQLAQREELEEGCSFIQNYRTPREDE